MPDTQTLQALQVLSTIGLLVFGVIAWAERYFRGTEKATAKSLAEQDKWNDSTARCIQSLTSQVNRANEEMSKVAGSWMVKVAQLDDHLRSIDAKVLTLELTVASLRDQVRANEHRLENFDQDGCSYGRDNRQRLEERRRREGDNR